MDKNYIELFKEIVSATEAAAEQVMEYDRAHEDVEGEKTATLMRDDYIALHDKISDENFDGVFSKNEYAKLLAGAYIVSNNLKDRVTSLQKVINGYENDIIPKLQLVMKEKTEEGMLRVSNEQFVLNI